MTRRRHKRPLKSDLELEWLAELGPDFSDWHALARAWISSRVTSLDLHTRAIVCFIERYIIALDLPKSPAVLLSRSYIAPQFFANSCVQSNAGKEINNSISKFLDFVLMEAFSVEDDRGAKHPLRQFHNPVSKITYKGMRRRESVYSALPYSLISEMRSIVASGPTFSDWKWATSVHGANIGARGGSQAADWFPVDESRIDKDDPNCVWRLRTRTQRAGQLKSEPVLEMWSPVRFVALLVKLILPLRTYQARMLDSGEFERDLYVGNSELWRAQQPCVLGAKNGGVFRRIRDEQGRDYCVIYCNTNKTADARETHKGYELPWPNDDIEHLGRVEDNIFYWLRTLRDWQVKYNPIDKLTRWHDLPATLRGIKSVSQLNEYPDSSFLFREPAYSGCKAATWSKASATSSDAHFPVSDASVERAYWALCRELQNRLAARGQVNHDGSPIKLVEKRSAHHSVPEFPLHSLRVSLITALAEEGGMEFHMLQKIAGHSRLIMTLYYYKPGGKKIVDSLSAALRRLEENREKTLSNWLANSEYERLLEQVVPVSDDGMGIALRPNIGERNPIGWLMMHHGACLVGGNTSAQESRNTGGCFNGGPPSPNNLNVYMPVPGGERNCVRCRWFVTEPSFLPGLVAHFNNLSYHWGVQREEVREFESALERALMEQPENAASKQERLYTAAVTKAQNHAQNMVDCLRLIDRCIAISDENRAGALVLAGSHVEVKTALGTTGSELEQFVRVCQDAEIYPDLDAGKATLARGQLLDSALMRDGLPPIFLNMSEKDQLLVGNSFINRIASKFFGDGDPDRLALAASLLDTKQRISDLLDHEDIRVLLCG